MAKSVSNQTVVVLALLLVLLVIGETFLILQELRTLESKMANRPRIPAAQPPGSAATTGQVTMFVVVTGSPPANAQG